MTGRGHGIIRGRKCPKIQLCPTCGQMRVFHPNADYFKCPVPKEVTEALRQFKQIYGTRWKSILTNMWTNGTEKASGLDEGLLRQARNMIGPSRLYKVRP